jgi:hypothetical protein
MILNRTELNTLRKLNIPNIGKVIVDYDEAEQAVDHPLSQDDTPYNAGWRDAYVYFLRTILENEKEV